MVTFKLIKSENNIHNFEYFPEGKTSLKCGIIILDEIQEKIYVSKVAETDFYSVTTAEELNEMRNHVNEMRVQDGEPPLTVKEWPNETENIGYYWYADHAIDVISDAYNKDGTVIKQGSAHWY